MGLLYDPPSGWRFRFPKPYLPLPGETFSQTLVRDGYPVRDVEFASQFCRFIGPTEELQKVMKGLRS